MAASQCTVSILRDASLRDAAQDEVSAFTGLTAWPSNRRRRCLLIARSSRATAVAEVQRVIASEAKQSMGRKGSMDCFAALAMTFWLSARVTKGRHHPRKRSLIYLRPHPEERALPAAHLRCPVRASRRMAASQCAVSILRDASLRGAPQDEVSALTGLTGWRSNRRHRCLLNYPLSRVMTSC